MSYDNSYYSKRGTLASAYREQGLLTLCHMQNLQEANVKKLFFCFFVGAFLALSRPATAQEIIIPDKIGSISDLAKSVLARDAKSVSHLLNNKKEDVNQRIHGKDKEAGFTPLILAAALSDAEITTILLQHGAQVNIVDDFGRSAFWYAALVGNDKITLMLTHAPRAEEVINTPDIDLKRTPLHMAVRHGNGEVVRLLLKAGASREAEDYIGDTPGTYCKSHVTEACKSLL